VSWVRTWLFSPDARLDPGYEAEIGRLFPGAPDDPVGKRKWVNEHQMLYIQTLLLTTDAHLDEIGVAGYPTWKNDAEGDSRWFFTANDHLSQLLGFLRQLYPLPSTIVPGQSTPLKEQEHQRQFTLGQLIRELEGRKMAFEQNSKTADRMESKEGSIAAALRRIQAAALRFQPDTATMPGIDRIEVLCDEIGGGTGLTSANVRQLRSRFCREKGCSLQEADECGLIEVANLLKGSAWGSPESVACPRHLAESGRFPFPSAKDEEMRRKSIQLWNTDPVQAFERLRDCICNALHHVIEVHRRAKTAPEGAILSNIAHEHFPGLGVAVLEAQAIWYETPIARYLDRPQGPVYLDRKENWATRRVSGSCHHDLALKVACGLLRWIDESIPAKEYVSMMRFYTVAGDHVGQHLDDQCSLVRCECQEGIARWKAQAIPALQGSNFGPERLDPSRCPGCRSPVPEDYSTLPSVHCLSCGGWELQTGLRVMPVAGPPGTPPKVVQLFSPYWQILLPDRVNLGEGDEAEDDERERRVDESGEETRDRKQGGGRRPLEESKPLQFQVYQRILQAHRAGTEHVETWGRLKADKDFIEQVKAAGLKPGVELVRKALAWDDQRRREQARKNQETDLT
jgi:hypothetical protein